MSSSPYVVGQWVRGTQFYGHDDLIDEILGGPRHCLWLLGSRRIGKTSLLKQLEHLTSSEPGRGYLPLFWDFQGAENAAELEEGFGEALLDAEESLARAGVPAGELGGDDLFGRLGNLRRRLRARGLRLLLLCDETEELLKLHRGEPKLLRKLRRALQASDDLRCVLASGVRLWALGEPSEDTSPFLHGFTPPLYIGPLNDDEAAALIRQTALPADSRPHIDEATVERIRTRCSNHPYLLQLASRSYIELGDADDAVEEVAMDGSVSRFFASDFEMLSPAERDVVRVVAAHSPSSSDSLVRNLTVDRGVLGESLHELERLGYLRRDEQRCYALAGELFARWLRDSSDAERSGSRGAIPSGEAATLTETVDAGVIDERYELLYEAGSGSNGRVFKARDCMLDVHIAIKLLRPEVASRKAGLERFRQEIVLAREIGHPNILRMFHLGESAGAFYVTMQWIDGPTLATRLAGSGPLGEAGTLTLGRKLSSALAAAHARRILHRDIKPQNILLEGGEEPYLTDFGLARLRGEPGLTHGNLFVGTPNYASPEQARLLPIDERADLYALGLVLFETATGARPFVAETIPEILELQRHAAPPDPREIAPELSAGLTQVILRCLRKDRDERFANATELLAALDALGPPRSVG